MSDNKSGTKLILVGNGMAGVNALEQLLKLSRSFDITLYGEEPYPNYNRIQLSYVLEGSKSIDEIVLNDRAWYEEHGITLHTGKRIEYIDTEAKRVYTEDGEADHYDMLILATGSKPFILPVPGAELEGVVGFRDIADCEAMMAASQKVRRAAVIGGGLLGLEAAKGLTKLGMEVTVVHLMDRLMERQLDETAAVMLKAELERQGIAFRLSSQTVALHGADGRVSELEFADGARLPAELVVMAAGIKPNVALAQASDLRVNRGILVDDYMRTSAPDVYAVGECCEHRGICYGLVAPLFEQAQTLARTLAGIETPPYEGSTVSTKLKISGVDVFSTGAFLEGTEHRVLRMHNEWNGTYKKVLLQEGRMVGAILYGDVSDSAQLTRWVKNGEPMTDEIYGELFGGSGAGEGCCGGAGKKNAAAAMADDEIVCGCNGVTKGTIVGVIRERGLTTVDEIKACTGATRSCGGCKPLVEQLLQAALGAGYAPAAAVSAGICGCTEHSRDEIVAAIRDMHLTHVQEVMQVLGWKQQEGCSKCRPAINYYLGMIYPTEHEDERDSRFVNERLHANIQKDGTFSVIPRMYGGLTTPEQLRKIADAADKYQVQAVKMTGGQRIDLLGVRKEDLPGIWAELDMPSGYGYAKALRTVKTCVGSRFCRFGTQDSMGMGIELERKYERLWMPAKFKMAVNGCPRNCAESGTKDLGIVGNDGGWEIYVGGNGGIKLRAADLLCKVKTDAELHEICGAFIQLYREQANYAERTSDWVERCGLDTIRQAVLEDVEQRRALNERIELALSMVEDPWQKAVQDSGLRSELYEPVVKG
ncbi:nitrite reductase (NADH) large subunit [Paenibacillus sp. UNCCL117]|uniref:nitrite reductase large subunit NirB n=1 Tax=unclassified Paenibacillus TaxID=185978 RepID=UPI0008812B6B|nr:MULTISPECIES: nitrite reductase large subunit NirB [unclassified Paenibacillus]SDD62183.1 assimilatory nitrite reductase (NAD(P)H) large subunit precursor [Paenibacillus sp. cl123]SFW67615.1 nitrite reductase (NADH) large subunit [Paenibacillus sp. UNCCL117]